jgi:ACS family tartrate transporter-like MFS transporter
LLISRFYIALADDAFFRIELSQPDPICENCRAHGGEQMDDGDRVFAKCAWRLIPFMGLLYLVSFIDRANVGFAALTMNKDLAFSPTIFGFGAGLFFVGYALFQVPANLILEQLGPRRWIFCIMVAWGALSAANSLVQGAASFYALRFLLGVAEAGFFPGMILYLTYWFPRAHRARFIALFMAAIPVSFIIGGPLSGAILGMDGVSNLAGWQWLFLLEGLPACLLAFAVLKFLPDGPPQATWLSADEKKTIVASLVTEASAEHHDLWPALCEPRVLALGLVNFGIQSGLYGVQLWLPQIVQAMGFSNLENGFVVALPFGVGMAAMILWGRSSDARGERIWHVALPKLLAASGFALAGIAQSDLLVLAALTLVLAGLLAAFGPMYSLLSSFLSGTAAAGGIALVIAIGTLGGFMGPTIIGVLKEATGDYVASMAALAILLVCTAAIVLALGRSMAPRVRARPETIRGT